MIREMRNVVRLGAIGSIETRSHLTRGSKLASRTQNGLAAALWESLITMNTRFRSVKAFGLIEP
jgi:hypothetical protein